MTTRNQPKTLALQLTVSHWWWLKPGTHRSKVRSNYIKCNQDKGEKLPRKERPRRERERSHWTACLGVKMMPIEITSFSGDTEFEEIGYVHPHPIPDLQKVITTSSCASCPNWWVVTHWSPLLPIFDLSAAGAESFYWFVPTPLALPVTNLVGVLGLQAWAWLPGY